VRGLSDDLNFLAALSALKSDRRAAGGGDQSRAKTRNLRGSFSSSSFLKHVVLPFPSCSTKEKDTWCITAAAERRDIIKQALSRTPVWRSDAFDDGSSVAARPRVDCRR